MGRQFELSEVEAGVKKEIEAINQEINETKQLIDNVAATEASLDSKIERRKIELERYEKRLQTLKKVRQEFFIDFIQNSFQNTLFFYSRFPDFLRSFHLQSVLGY